MRFGWLGRFAVLPAVCMFVVAFERSATQQQSDVGRSNDAQSSAALTTPANSNQDSPTQVALIVGKSMIFDFAVPLERITVGFGDVAEGRAISPRELLLNGKAAGITSLIVWLEDGSRRFFDVTVGVSTLLSDQRIENIRQELKRELPEQTINLTFENETVFLRGTVKDITSADRAVSIASTLGKTVNLLYVDVPSPEPQILLKVKFASVDRNTSTSLGLNIFSTGATNTVGTTGTNQYSGPTVSPIQGGSSTPVVATISDALNLFFFRPDLNLGATIEALEVKGLLQILAEPNMLAENGKPASFLAGGEFPYPTVSTGTGGTPTVSISFREYGVRLTFLPTITPRGTIHLQVAPEVSALDYTNGLTLSGYNVPAITTRKLNTQVELGEGQSFAIGGLLDNRTTDTFEKIPFIGDVPILGKLFQSKSVTKNNTELIVIVTPELVRPIPAGQPLPGLKYEKPFLPPNTGIEMHTPSVSVTGPAITLPPFQAIPVEKLIKSLLPITMPGVPVSAAATSTGSAPPH